MKKKTSKLSWFGTGAFTIIGIVYIMPILIVLINSFKNKVFINKEPFKLPTKQTWVGIDNFLSAIDKYELLSAVGWTVFITVWFRTCDPCMYFYVCMVYYKSKQ